MKVLLTGLSCVCAIGLAGAADLYVDKGNPSADDANPGTESAPFKTIQAAVDAVAAGESGYDFAAGDTIWVKPGDYDEGGYVDDYQTNRICILSKCRIVSTAGKEKTSIVGCHDPESGWIGPGAVRCVKVTTAGQGSILQGFTLRDGATSTESAGSANYYGGVFMEGLWSKDFYLVDSTVRNCTALQGGGMGGGTAIRCYFVRNDLPWLTGAYAGAAGYGMSAWCCVFFENAHKTNGSVLNNCVTVNCTVYYCSGKNGTRCELRHASSQTYNSLVYEHDTAKDCTIAGTSENNVTTLSPAVNQYHNVAPALGDWRLVNTSAAVGAAVSNHLTKVSFPAEIARTDFNGRPIPSTETLNCGAVQEVVTPASGRVAVETGSVEYTLDGHECSGANAIVGGFTYFYGATYPTNFIFKPAKLALNMTNARLNSCGNYGPYPDWRNELLLTPPVAGDSHWYVVQYPSATYWVSAGADGSDDNDGLSETTPLKTLAKAGEKINAAGKWSLVLLKPGVYDSGANGSYRLQITKNNIVVVRGTEGPDRTFVVGGDGVGGFGFTAYMGGVSGLTITGCRNAEAVSCQQPLSYVIDCTISNNTTSGTVVKGGRLQNTRILANAATGSGGCVWDGSYACGTLFADNTNESANAIIRADNLYHCTIAGRNKAKYLFKASKFVNSIACGPGTYDNRTAIVSAPGSFLYDMDVGTVIPDGVSTEDPQILSSGIPLATSPTLGRGAFAADDAMTNDLYRIQSSGGADGPSYAFTAEGRHTSGAYQGTLATAAVILEPEYGGLEITGAQWGENIVAAGGSLTFAVKQTHVGSRWVRGLDVNGTYIDLSAYPDGWTHTVSSPAESVKVKPVYSTSLYAAPDGDPSADGLTPETATTLRKVSEMAHAGETICLLPGLYEGDAMPYGGQVTSNRAVLAKGVNLASVSGKCEDTVIRGAPGVGGIYSNGCVRCLTLLGENVVSNVTLCGGYSYCLAPIQDSGTREHDAAVNNLGTCDTAFLVGCIISNCHSSVRSVANNATFIRCRISDCAAGWYDVILNSRLYGCILKGCSIAYPLDAATEIVNCTLGPHSGIWGSLNYCWNGKTKVYNTLILDGGMQGASVRGATFYRSYFGKINPTGAEEATWEDGSKTNADVTAMELTDNLTPVKGACDALDAGNDAYLALYPARFAEHAKIDVYGNPRVLGASVDVGAVEYDWCPDFAADLGGRLLVPTASAGVVETEAKAVRLTDGSSLTVRPSDAAHAAKGRRFPFTVKDGTLTVSVNGTVVATYADDGEWCYENGAASDEVVFAFAASAADGCAELLRTHSPQGLTILVR